MSQQSRAHDYLEWAKQKLDEIGHAVLDGAVSGAG